MEYFHSVLGCHCVKRWHEGRRNRGFLAVFAQSVLKLRHHHVHSPVEEIHGAVGLSASNCDISLAFILLCDFGELGQAQIGYAPGGQDSHFVIVVELEGAQIFHSMLLVVRIEGIDERESVVATNDFNLTYDLRFEDRFLTWQKVAKFDGHNLVLLFAFGKDRCVATSDCVFVSLPGCILLHDFGLDYSIIYDGLKLG